MVVLSLRGRLSAQGAGLRYPEDVSLAGYDGIPMAKVMSPQITTIEQDSYALGMTAAQKLIDAIDGKTAESKVTVIEGKLIRGESVHRLS